MRELIGIVCRCFAIGTVVYGIFLWAATEFKILIYALAGTFLLAAVAGLCILGVDLYRLIAARHAAKAKSKPAIPYDKIIEILNSSGNKLGKISRPYPATLLHPIRRAHAGVMRGDLGRWRDFAEYCVQDDWWAGRDNRFRGAPSWGWLIRRAHEAFERDLVPRKLMQDDHV